MSLIDPSLAPPDPLPPRRGSESRGRRRRRTQLVVPHDNEGRAAMLAPMARRAYPTYELFIYAAICGGLLGLGYFLDSQALLLFGVLVAPLLLPWIGLLLATVTGSARFFFETFMALLVAAALVFLIGLVSGFASRPFLPRTFNEAFIHSRLWWPDLLLLALGAIILTVSFVRSESKPYLPSVVLAYEFFLPLSAGGFGLGAGLPEVWPHGLLVFFVHFAWACMFGLLTLVALRFLPTSASAFVFSAAVAFVLLVVLVVLMSGGNWTQSLGARPVPSAAPPAQPGTVSAPVSSSLSPTPLIETPTPGNFLTPAVIPLTVAVTLPPAATPTVTMTIRPTPVYAQVQAPRGGAVLREVPGGKGIATLDNFTYVELLPEQQVFSGYTWQHVIAVQYGNQREGWIVTLYLQTPTPPPGAAASTPTP